MKWLLIAAFGVYFVVRLAWFYCTEDIWSSGRASDDRPENG